MSKGTKVRTVRIDDALWEAAQAKSKRVETDLSKVIREKLETWLAEDD